MRIEFEKKCALYRNQDARGEDQLVIDRTRANIKMLQTRMAVAVHAVESAAAEVQRLRDDELYPQLLQLLEEYGSCMQLLLLVLCNYCFSSSFLAVVPVKQHYEIIFEAYPSYVFEAKVHVILSSQTCPWRHGHIPQIFADLLNQFCTTMEWP